MALGVLNNLSAIYAENNLNNTNNSLQTVLQQLSSGSRSTPAPMMQRAFRWSTASRPTPQALTQSQPTPPKAWACCRWPTALSRK